MPSSRAPSTTWSLTSCWMFGIGCRRPCSRTGQREAPGRCRGPLCFSYCCCQDFSDLEGPEVLDDGCLALGVDTGVPSGSPLDHLLGGSAGHRAGSRVFPEGRIARDLGTLTGGILLVGELQDGRLGGAPLERLAADGIRPLGRGL